MTGIGVNVHRFGPATEAALLLLRPPVILGSHPDWAMLDRLAFDFDFFYRHIPDGANADNLGADPADLAMSTLEAIAGHRHRVKAVIGYNEALQNGNVDTQVRRERSYVRLMQSMGVNVIAGNVAVGNLEREHLPLLAGLIREAWGFAYHGYCRPGATDLDPPEHPWHLRRPADLWLPVLERHGLDLSRFGLGETGTFSAPFPGMTGREYALLLIAIHEYALRVGMRWTAAWTLDAYEPWVTQQPWLIMERQDCMETLAEYNRTHQGETPSVGHPGATTGIVEGEDTVPSFVLGFKDLADKLGASVVGEPQVDEKTLRNADGSQVLTVQTTSKGLMVYQAGGQPLFLPGKA